MDPLISSPMVSTNQDLIFQVDKEAKKEVKKDSKGEIQWIKAQPQVSAWAWVEELAEVEIWPPKLFNNPKVSF